MSKYEIKFADDHETCVQALTESDACDIALQEHGSKHYVRGCHPGCTCVHGKTRTIVECEEVG